MNRVEAIADPGKSVTLASSIVISPHDVAAFVDAQRFSVNGTFYIDRARRRMIKDEAANAAGAGASVTANDHAETVNRGRGGVLGAGEVELDK